MRPATPPRTALVRAVPSRLADAELTHLPRTAIDVDRARVEHAGYVATLERLGLGIVWAPSADHHADAAFVEDVAVVVGDLAVVTRPGAASRRGETDGIAEVLGATGLEVTTLPGPGTLDGGDVLQVGDTVFVGRGSRTDAAGARALRELAEPRGHHVVEVEVTGALHLKTAATALPDGTIIAVPGAVAPGSFLGAPVLAAPEPAGADVLLVGDQVVLSAAAPRTAELVAARGFAVHPVAIGEFEKAEAGPTCLSVLLPR